MLTSVLTAIRVNTDHTRRPEGLHSRTRAGARILSESFSRQQEEKIMDNVNEGVVAMRSLYPPWSLVETIASTMRRSGALSRMVFSAENDACIWRKGERTDRSLTTIIVSIDESIGPGTLDASVAELLEERMQHVLALAITRTCQAWHKHVIYDLSAWHKKVMPSLYVFRETSNTQMWMAPFVPYRTLEEYETRKPEEADPPSFICTSCGTPGPKGTFGPGLLNKLYKWASWHFDCHSDFFPLVNGRAVAGHLMTCEPDTIMKRKRVLWYILDTEAKNLAMRVAVMMAAHDRLGAESAMHVLGKDLFQLLLMEMPF